MPTLSSAALAILACLGSPVTAVHLADPAARQPGRTLAAPPATSEVRAVRTRLSTIVDHVDLLGGHYVELPPSRVTRILSPTLAELRDPRQRGISQLYWAEDRVLVLLPQGTRVSEGDEVVVEAWVRTVNGAAASGELTGVDEGLRGSRRNEPLLVAASVETIDGVSLAGTR